MNVENLISKQPAHEQTNLQFLDKNNDLNEVIDRHTQVHGATEKATNAYWE